VADLSQATLTLRTRAVRRTVRLSKEHYLINHLFPAPQGMEPEYVDGGTDTVPDAPDLIPPTEGDAVQTFIDVRYAPNAMITFAVPPAHFVLRGLAPASFRTEERQ
jgi:hypothetical protein